MVLLIDNYDSFTYNLKDYLEQLGLDVDIKRNTDADLINLNYSEYEGLVLSPGPGTPSQSGYLMDVVEAVWDKLPVLGICLGHQALGEFFGLVLQRATYPMHGKISELYHSGHAMFQGLPLRFEVCRYHSLVLKRDKSKSKGELEVTGWSEDGTIMAISHKTKPLWGVQYHPEAILTQHGLALLNNWVNVINLHRTT